MSSRIKDPVLVVCISLFLLVSIACSGKEQISEVSITYPKNGTLFPPDLAPPSFQWSDPSEAEGVQTWRIRFDFQDSEGPLEFQTDTAEWMPAKKDWDIIKERTKEREARFIVSGVVQEKGRERVRSEGSIGFITSKDEVGAPIFFRDVPLPFSYALAHTDYIKWRLGDISSENPPKIVLENMVVCGNCHSFSKDGSRIGMDVDYANDKGSYFSSDVEPVMILSRDKIITWSDYRREDGELTFGLLSQVSPDGRYAISTVKDRSVFVPVDDLYFSQLFFPLKGILAYYDYEMGVFSELPGADDKEYVQSNPNWSPDGKYIIFARSKAETLRDVGDKVVLERADCEEFITGGKKFRFDLYRMTFNEGRGGQAVAIPGASNNGKSNYFARYSPDGRWIVFCQADSFMLLQPDSRLFIMPAEGGTPREMNCNTDKMNSWHSWSPNSRWLVFSSKGNTPYTQLFLTHVDENGNDSPPVLLSRFTTADRAANIPEFVNIRPDQFTQIKESFIDYYNYTRRGKEYEDLGLLTDAERMYRRALEMNPDDALTWSFLGTLLSKLNKLQEAEEALNRALKLDPANVDAHMALGAIYLNRFEHAKARSEFEAALSHDDKCAPAYEGLGLIALQAEDFDEAQKRFEAAVSHDSRLLDAYHRLGMIYMTKGEYEKAKKSFSTVLERKYDEVSTIYLGRAQFLLGEYEGAEKSFRTVYEKNPNETRACFMLARTLSMMGKGLDEALVLLKKTLQALPKYVDAHIELGNVYLRLGDKDQAISAYEKALSLNPDIPELRANLERLKAER
jgi:tetratricopeptide (TPR) repeat protein